MCSARSGELFTALVGVSAASTPWDVILSCVLAPGELLEPGPSK